MTMRASVGSSAAAGMPTSAAISSSLGNTRDRDDRADDRDLGDVLDRLDRARCGLNMFFRPGGGLSFLKSGLIASA